MKVVVCRCVTTSQLFPLGLDNEGINELIGMAKRSEISCIGKANTMATSRLEEMK